jgi:hypothetical protein
MMVSGALTMGLGGTHTYAEVTVVRFLLGVFEAGESTSSAETSTDALHTLGLFPGLVYFLTFWYKYVGIWKFSHGS